MDDIAVGSFDSMLPRARRSHFLSCSPKSAAACWPSTGASRSRSCGSGRLKIVSLHSTWSSPEAHDAAFGGSIMASGHLEKVLGVLDEGVIQTFYDVVS